MNQGPPAKTVTYDEALEILLGHAVPGTEVLEVPVAEAVGHVLAESVTSPVDMPRFDRAAMDGFAFRHLDARERNPMKIAGTIAAGDPPGMELPPDECVRIMTGAPVPAGADTVVPIEDTAMVDDHNRAAAGEAGWVRFHTVPGRGAHIAPRGQDVRQGDVVAQAAQVIRAPLVSILASTGRQVVRVHAGPRIAFAATGEELVEPGETLQPGQIFNSNAPALQAQILAAKGRPHYLGILRDRVEELREAVQAGLAHDMLILSGGVSMGAFDHVPAVLRELGVELHFQKLYVKPGRPTVFGTRGRTLVFGLPGNPISTLYAFDQYVAPAIRAYRWHPRPLTPRYRGELTETVRKPAGRLLLQPCSCAWVDDRFLLTPIRTHGSADVFAIGQVEALALIPAGVEEIERGTAVAFRRLFED